MSDISETARISYDAGIDPIDYAEGCVRDLIGAHLNHPAEVPLDALSRRILGGLLDIGWKSPEAS